MPASRNSKFYKELPKYNMFLFSFAYFVGKAENTNTHTMAHGVHFSVCFFTALLMRRDIGKVPYSQGDLQGTPLLNNFFSLES